MQRAVTILMAAIIGLATAACGDSTGPETRPVSGSISGQAVIDPNSIPAGLSNPCPVTHEGSTLPLPVLVQGSGQISPLGRVEIRAIHCTEAPDQLTTLPNEIGGGTSIWSVDDGGQFRAAYEGIQKSAPPAGRDSAVIAYTVTGGDGPFRGASGSLDAAGLLNLQDFTVEQEISGRLRY